MLSRRTAVVVSNTDLLKDQVKQMLKKTRQKKHGSHPTILSRWYVSETYRTSLSLIGWKEKDTMHYDRIALEKHVYVATRAKIM